MTVESAINPQNMIHLILAITIITLPILALFLLSLGFRKDQRSILARTSFIAAILILFFDLSHLFAIKNGWDILGLLQRLSVYSFHAFTFFLSWIYVRKTRRTVH
ncbi:PF06197 domain protein [Clostridium sp. MSTE9]|nr:PF06197 domain protein [Clostridium sp. MSTE9]